MKAYEVPVKVSADGQLELPGSVSRLLPVNQVVRLIILVDEPDNQADAEWARLTAEQFFAGYSEADSIYDEP